MTQAQFGVRPDQADAWSTEAGPDGAGGDAPRLSAFLVVDLAETSAVLEQLGEGRVEASRTAYLTLLRNAIAAQHGRELSRRVDRLLVAFDTPSEAVACAVAVQRACERHNRRRIDRLDVRAGIQLGEVYESAVVSERGDVVAGPAIQAGGLCDAAAGNQALVSDLVSVLASAEGAFGFERVGLLDIVGSREPMTAFEVS